MVVLEIEENTLSAAMHNCCCLEIKGNSNTLKVQQNHGTIKVNGDVAKIYLDGGLDHVTVNDLLYQIVEVVELILILLIFYVIFSNVNY